MRALLDRLANPLHALIALAAAWLLASCFWLELYKALPPDAGLIDRSHVWLGLALLPLAATYLLGCTLGGRWRLYFPWLAGDVAQIGRDLAGLARGARPMSEGGGLFGAIEGLLLLALVATAATGAAWFATQGSSAAVSWREVHILAARGFAGLLAAHLLAVAAHLLDLIGD